MDTSRRRAASAPVSSSMRTKLAVVGITVWTVWTVGATVHAAHLFKLEPATLTLHR